VHEQDQQGAPHAIQILWVGFLGLLSAVALLVGSCSCGDQGCTKDTDCKGDRICVQGSCEYPAGADAGNVGDASSFPCDLSLSPVLHDFGSVPQGTTSSPVVFTLMNSACESTGLLTVAITGANASEFTLSGGSCFGSPLVPQASCLVVVEFSPTSVGSKSATLSLSATASCSVSAALTGAGFSEGCGSLSINPSQANFVTTNVGLTSQPTSFTVTNQGSCTTGSLTTVLGGPEASQFVITSNTCESPLAPSGTCSMEVEFAPFSLGTQTANLTVAGEPGGSAAATLVGNIVTAELSIAPPLFQFGAVCLEAFSGCGTPTIFTVTNDGNATTGTPTASISGPNASEFVISSNNCTAPISAGASCSVQITFTPTSVGALAASLNASANPGGVATAALSGTGLACGPGTSISPSFQDFGAVSIGTASMPVAFTFASTFPCATGPLSTSLGGVNAAEFSIMTDGCSGQTLDSNSSCVVTIEFLPTTAGLMSATLSVGTTDGGFSTASLTGNGVSFDGGLDAGSTNDAGGGLDGG
jgi:hypothetical protein